MRELYRNPILYYVLAPILVSCWPLLVWGYYLPRETEAWERDEQLSGDAQNLMLELLDKDPERLRAAAESQKIGKFTYFEVVNRVANLCRIPSGSLNLSTGDIITSGKKQTQQARVGLTNVGIVQAARFLDTIQAMWVNLTCNRIELSKKEGMPDQWDMDLSFRYDY